MGITEDVKSHFSASDNAYDLIEPHKIPTSSLSPRRSLSDHLMAASHQRQISAEPFGVSILIRYTYIVDASTPQNGQFPQGGV